MSDTASSSNNVEKKAEMAAAYVGPAPAAHSDEEKGPYRTVGDSGVIVNGESKFSRSTWDYPVLTVVAATGELAVHRTLKQRHMAMIALGGAIGTGLFIGSGGALAAGGPVGVWLGYTIMATMVYSMMVALGEMAALYPLSGGFTHYAARFVDPALGFAVGLCVCPGVRSPVPR